MGQSIVVTEKPSSTPGVVRYETNRAFTGMGHEHYHQGDEESGDRPPDELARRILARGGVTAVHVNGNIVTVDLQKGHDADGIKAIVENLYRFYPDAPEGAEAAAEPSAEAEAASGEEPAGEEAALPRASPPPRCWPGWRCRPRRCSAGWRRAGATTSTPFRR